MSVSFTIIAAISGALGVLLGAFGAHMLKARLSDDRLGTFETAVRYHLLHSLALLFTSLGASAGLEPGWLMAAGWLFSIGILLFSGSLYLLVFTGKRALGAITPFGGVAFILAWICLGIGAL